MNKILGIVALAGSGLVAQQEYAALTSQGVVEGHVTTVSINDKSLENGALDSELQITFDVAGTQCDTNVAAEGTYTILKSQQAGVFDNLVKTAQAAYLSGKVMRYSSAKSSASSPCYAYYMQLK